MRSQADPKFSDLSDRVKTGKVTEEDIAFLKSRVVARPSEMSNESFKVNSLRVSVKKSGLSGCT